MVLVAVRELIPEAWSAIGAAGALLTATTGAICLWAINALVPHSHLAPEHGLAEARLVRTAYAVVIGLILHDVPEGFAMANAYAASPSLGVRVALAIALHNLPEELAMAVPAMGLRSKTFLIWAAVLSALAEPAGAFVGLAAVQISPALNGQFMAFAAGAMLYVSFHELVPMAQRYSHLGWFGAGLAMSVAVHSALTLATMRAM